MSKYKSKSSTTPEVFFARNKLDGLLQTLVDKTTESSPEQEEPLVEDEDVKPPSLPTTPTKRPGTSSKASRKRRRGKDDDRGPEMGQYHHTYVMKLFDRSVDLAQFDDDAPLYPICRAWMRNQPHNKSLGLAMRSPSPDPMDEEDTDSDGLNNVYRLPSPVSVKRELDFDMKPKQISRIPQPVPQPDEHLDIHLDPEMAPPPEQLLLSHMARWKNIRQRWKDSALASESRYGPGMTILRDMFDRQCGKE